MHFFVDIDIYMLYIYMWHLFIDILRDVLCVVHRYHNNINQKGGQHENH